jgi:hypothetical protein
MPDRQVDRIDRDNFSVPLGQLVEFEPGHRFGIDGSKRDAVTKGRLPDRFIPERRVRL